jgi:hypothetical protein
MFSLGTDKKLSVKAHFTYEKSDFGTVGRLNPPGGGLEITFKGLGKVG